MCLGRNCKAAASFLGGPSCLYWSCFHEVSLSTSKCVGGGSSPRGCVSYVPPGCCSHQVVLMCIPGAGPGPLSVCKGGGPLCGGQPSGEGAHLPNVNPKFEGKAQIAQREHTERLWFSGPHLWVCFFLRFYLFIFTGTGREGERAGEKYQCVIVSHTPQSRELARNPGTVLRDQESNP